MHAGMTDLGWSVVFNAVSCGESIHLDGGAAPTVVIRITDTGFGIEQNDLPKIFLPFFSATKGKGLGLGLPICERIIKNHGGRIEVESEPGSGTIFSVYLPHDYRPKTTAQAEIADGYSSLPNYLLPGVSVLLRNSRYWFDRHCGQPRRRPEVTGIPVISVGAYGIRPFWIPTPPVETVSQSRNSHQCHSEPFGDAQDKLREESRVATTRSFGYRLRMTLLHSLV